MHGRSPELARPRTKSCSYSLGHRQLKATANMPLCTLGKTLATDKTTSEFKITDKNEMRVETYFSDDGVQIARQPDPRRTISWGSCTGAEDCVLQRSSVKVFQTNYKRDNKLFHRLIKFAMCTGRKKRLRHYNLRTGQ